MKLACVSVLSLLVACSRPPREPKANTTRSAGCGTPHQAAGGFQPLRIDVGGLTRSYAFFVPPNYDANVAYPLIFRFHGHGGSQDSGGLEIDQASEGRALIVSPDGLLSGDGKNRSWSTRNEAADLALFDALLRQVQSEYCVDPRRVFAYGFSAGGGFSQALACARGDVLRAVGSISANRRGNGSCRGTVSAYLRYDRNDPAVPLHTGEGVRDDLLAQNRCTQDTTSKGTCQRYARCSQDESIVWCVGSSPVEHAHDPGGLRVANEVWSFFASLR